MDPNTNLREQLKIAEGVLDAEVFDPDELPRLAELVVELDEWMQRGGFPPSRWQERNARHAARSRRRRQAGFMESLTGIFGKLTGSGDDKKQAPTSTDAAHAAHAGPTSTPSHDAAHDGPRLIQSRPVAMPPPAPTYEHEPIYWPPRGIPRNAIGPSWTMPYDPSREDLCRSPSWCNDIESARAEWATKQRNG